ncbi:MAG: class I SAM-dependent methyltransferase [Acetobacteraceae bacterium]
MTDPVEPFPGKGTLWVPDHSGEHYLDVLRRLHEFLQPRAYLEIGCAKGRSLSLANCASVAVDPRPRLADMTAVADKPVFALYQMTSDEFFTGHDPAAILGSPIDLAFLDGMHLSEYLLRDFINAERCCRRDSVIVLHDCLPVEWPMTERVRNAQPPIREHHRFSWAGDVWRTALLLKRRRPDLRMTAYAAPPTGLLCVTNLSPMSTVLSGAYHDCVSEMMGQSLRELGIDALYTALGVEPTSVLESREELAARFLS